MDLVIAGHTNDEFVCEIDGKWVTMADNAARLFTVIDVTLDRETKDLTVQKHQKPAEHAGGSNPGRGTHSPYREVRVSLSSQGERRNRHS